MLVLILIISILRGILISLSNPFLFRSHVIIELKIEIIGKGKEKRVAKVRFVDLAGSEKVRIINKKLIFYSFSIFNDLFEEKITD